MDIFSNFLTLVFLLISLVKTIQGQCPDSYAICPTREIFEVSDPAIYYASTDGLVGLELKTELNSIIRGHKQYTYACVWTALAETDADPLNPNNVITIYNQNSLSRLDRDCQENNGNSDAWNREHVWPKSHGFPSQGQHAYTDIHHLVPADKSINFDRSDSDFKSGGQPNDECSGCYEGEFNGGTTWEPPDLVKGQIARMLFYMATRYDGTDFNESDTPELTIADDSTANPDPKIGVLSDLLQWHCDFPVSDHERLRNNIVESWQGNRNPFIDRPGFVESIWNYNCDGENPPMPSPITSNLPTTSNHPTSAPGTENAVWINEFHYDNVGTDVGEFVEIGCNQDVDLISYRVVLYNGAGGGYYDEAEVSGICSTDNFVVVEFSIIQNGPDGIALVNADDIVLEFLSYEGSFTATNGPAIGMDSVNIDVSETSSTVEGYSLQLVGIGCESIDFTWQGPFPTSEGNVNIDQTISCNEPTTAPTVSPIAAPTTTPTIGDCVDSPLNLSITQGRNGCSFVASDPQYFCSLDQYDLYSHCPNTCAVCSEYKCKDSTMQFTFRGYDLYCSDIPENILAIACGQQDITKTCRESCNYCDE